jgi:hypothetical protein
VSRSADRDDSGPAVESPGALYPVALSALDRVVAEHPTEFRYERLAASTDGGTTVVFSRTVPPRRAIVFHFSPGELEVFQLTSVDGDPLEERRSVRRIRSSASQIPAVLADVLCWVLTGGTDIP